MQSIIFTDSYKPQFSGHETFPLRHGWLKKVCDAVNTAALGASPFSTEDAIARFGVGKNMVAAMRFWASSFGLIHEAEGGDLQLTNIGREIFVENGLDPYVENANTLWLLHWFITTLGVRTTWYYVFNHLPSLTLDRDSLLNDLEFASSKHNWQRTSVATKKRDIEVFFRTYGTKLSSNTQNHEDNMESPFTELGLIRAIGKDSYRLNRGPKFTLSDGVFIYALMEFWNNYFSTATISFDNIMSSPGSPARVFLLEENDLVDRLTRVEDLTDGEIRWSESAGLRQVVRKNTSFDLGNAFNFIRNDYKTASETINA